MTHEKHILLWSVLLFLLAGTTTLGAAVTAAYEPEIYLRFGRGEYPFANTDFVGLVGTITFSSTGEKIYDPSFSLVSTSDQFEFEGPRIDHYENGIPILRDKYRSRFRLVAVYSINGQEYKRDVWAGNSVWPITGTGSLGISAPFVVKLYLQSWENADAYVEGAYYSMVGGNLNTFHLAVANPGSTIYNGAAYISVNNASVPPDGSAPEAQDFFAGGGSDTIDSIPYGDPDEEWDKAHYLFSITDNTSFPIGEAIGNESVPIAEARMRVTNGNDNVRYGVYLSFTDSAPGAGDPFTLYLDGDSTKYGIPYRLKFLGQEIEPDTGTIFWSDLNRNGETSADISVTGINSERVGGAPTGAYSDTVTVRITATDTF